MSNEKTFQDLGLSESLLKAITKKGFEKPSDIQAATIPVMLKNEINIIAQAQTGTGKTAAFGLPLVEMINQSQKQVQALILVPTRELANQVAEEISTLQGSKKLNVVAIYGGQPIGQQISQLKRGAHIVVGSPGRIIDHLNRKTLRLGELKHLILDEADEMLNMGFVDDMEEIIKHTNADKRMLLFSATMPKRIKELAHKYMGDYKHIVVKQQQGTTNLIEQIYFEVKAFDKFEALCRIIDMEEEFYGLVFCRTKRDADAVASHLIDRDYGAEAIHGDISQGQREKTLKKFKKQKINILVATDVAARGIDVNNLTHVINYSLPQDPESYVHRVGRTGRAGKQGTAVTFITPSEYRQLMFIKRISKTDIKKSKVPQVNEIIDAKKKRIFENLGSVLDKKIDKSYYEWASKLLENNDSTMILAAVLSHCFEDDLNPDTYGEIREVGHRGQRGDKASKGDKRGAKGSKGFKAKVDQKGKARLFVALGKQDKMNAKKLVNLISRSVSIKSSQIMEIQVMERFSFITVPFSKAEQIIEGFKKGKGERSLITHANTKMRKSGKPSSKGKSWRRKPRSK